VRHISSGWAHSLEKTSQFPFAIQHVSRRLWPFFDGANGFGMGFEGVVANDLFVTGDRFAITGGFGVGFVDDGHNNTFGSSSDNVWGGRVGGQWTW
jgi:hypothetical protein